jgi:hypothetical protein
MRERGTSRERKHRERGVPEMEESTRERSSGGEREKGGQAI